MLKEGEIRIPSGCAIAAIIDRKGNRINGSQIIKSIALILNIRMNTLFMFSMIQARQESSAKIFFLGILILMLRRGYLPAKFQALKKALIFGVISARQTVCE